MIACLSHDLNHSKNLINKIKEGVNNLYKVKKSKKLNRNICESAVLESMHVSTLFNILAQNQ